MRTRIGAFRAANRGQGFLAAGLGRPSKVLCRWRRDRQQRAEPASAAADDCSRLRDTRTDARLTADVTAVSDVVDRRAADSAGRTPQCLQCLQPVDLSRQSAEDADANWHVKPVQPPVTEPDLKKHNHEQPDTDTRDPRRYSASPPLHDGGDSLDEYAELQRNRDDRVDPQGA